MGTSSKTTILGILTIVGAIVTAVVHLIQGQPVDYGVTVAAITSGIGLITAKDYNVTGGTVAANASLNSTTSAAAGTAVK